MRKMTARLPSLNGLRAFEAAARHLSFTVAASELNVTQTAISHQIRRLEQELGIRLFIRQNRALALTPAAKDYLPGVRAAFNDLRLATDRLLRKDNDHVLTVSTLASLAAKWLLPRLSAFQEAHLGLDVPITHPTPGSAPPTPPRPRLKFERGGTALPGSATAVASGEGCARTG